MEILYFYSTLVIWQPSLIVFLYKLYIFHTYDQNLKHDALFSYQLILVWNWVFSFIKWKTSGSEIGNISTCFQCKSTCFNNFLKINFFLILVPQPASLSQHTLFSRFELIYLKTGSNICIKILQTGNLYKIEGFAG